MKLLIPLLPLVSAGTTNFPEIVRNVIAHKASNTVCRLTGRNSATIDKISSLVVNAGCDFIDWTIYEYLTWTVLENLGVHGTELNQAATFLTGYITSISDQDQDQD